MANTRSAKKAIRSSAKKREHNLFWKRRISAAEKAALSAGILKESFSVLQKVLDKAVKEKVIHKNKAARIKSRIYKKISANATKPKPTKSKSKEA